MLQSGSKSLYHHVDYGRDHCHWLYKKRKLRYTPRNPLPRFLCLELLCLSAWQLHLHQLSSVSSPFIIGGCTPSIRCLCNNSLSILVCIGKVFAYCLHQEHKRLHVVHNFYTISALSFIWELFFSLHLLSHFSTSLDHEYSCTISVCPRAISVLQISPYFLLMFDSSSSCHNTCSSQNRVPIFISLLYFSSIIRVFINSTLEKLQSPNLTSLEKSPLHQILEHMEPNCSLVPSSC